MDAADAADQLHPTEASGRPQRNPTAVKGKKKRFLESGEEGSCPQTRMVAEDSLKTGPAPLQAPAAAEAPAAACQVRKPTARARKSTKAAVAAAAQQEWLLGQEDAEEEEEKPRKRARAACRVRGRVRARNPRIGEEAAALCQSSASEQQGKAALAARAEPDGCCAGSSGQPADEAAGVAACMAHLQLGLSAVQPPAAACALPQRGSVAAGAESTWQLQGYSAMPQMTELREVLEWVSVSARAGGLSTVPFCTGAASASAAAVLAPCWQPAAVERRYRAALGRARTATFAPSADAAEELSLTRRSGRVRQLPDVFVPFEEPGFGRSQRERRESTAMLEGPGYQAKLPACRPRPKQLPKGEAAWLGTRVLAEGAWGPVSDRVPVRAAFDASTGAVLWEVNGRALAAATAQGLGLCKMGAAVRQSWTHADISAFEAAVTAHGKDFELIAAELGLLPGKGVSDAVDFFYNAWKTRGLERARAWYARRAQEKLQERLVQESAAAVDRGRPSGGDRAPRDGRSAERIAADRKASQVRAEHRRQIKDTLVYIRECIRRPRHANYSRTRMLDRLQRGRQVLQSAPAGLKWQEAMMEGL